MKKKQDSSFLSGLLVGLTIGSAIWYWQKSTAADDGAIALLDRLKAADDTVRQLRGELTEEVDRGIILPENDGVPPFLDTV